MNFESLSSAQTPISLAAIAAGIIFLVRYLKSFSLGMQKDGAEADVIKLLRDQLQEVSNSNASLRKELNEARDLFANANFLVNKFKIENENMRLELGELRVAVRDLRLKLDRYTKPVDGGDNG